MGQEEKPSVRHKGRHLNTTDSHSLIGFTVPGKFFLLCPRVGVSELSCPQISVKLFACSVAEPILTGVSVLSS